MPQNACRRSLLALVEPLQNGAACCLQSARMKICHIVASLEARYGGPSKSVRRLAASSAALGNEVELLTSAPVPYATEMSGHLTVRTWQRGWPGAFCPVPGMADHLRQSSCDVVHHHGLWLRTLHYARVKAARDRVPLVVSPRGMMNPWAWQRHRTRKAFAASFLHPGAMRAASGWHATSQEEAAEICARGFAQPVCVAPNGVDRPDAADTAASLAFWRQRVPDSDTRPVALFYSRLHEKKRVIELIELWAKLAPRDWLLLVAGIPEQYSVDDLRQRVAQLGATEAIRVEEGTHHPPPYALASLFLLPSRAENFGLVIAESMAHGVPVLVTDATPWSAVNTHAAGWCVAWEDYADALKAAITEARDRLRERGARAREWVLREFSWEKAAAQLGEFYAALRKGAS